MIAPLYDPATKSPPRLLLVEDHLGSASVMARLLTHFGFIVRVECDGADAVRAAGDFAPTIALIDLTLPTLDGCSVARRLRASETTRDTALIAMTGWADDRHAQESRAAGFDMHLVKPIGVEALLDALQSASASRHR